MDTPNTPELKTNELFMRMNPSLSRQEYLQMKQMLLADGCTEPFIVWNGILLVDYNHYEFCRSNNIPYQVTTMEFDSMADATIWLCKYQMEKPGLPEELRKYLIGQHYGVMKAAHTQKNRHGVNQYTGAKHANRDSPNPPPFSGHKTAREIGALYHIAWTTVQKYGAYAEAIDVIAKKAPDVIPKLLSGKFKVSHENTLQISALSQEHIRTVVNRLEMQASPFSRNNGRRQAQRSSPPVRSPGAPPAKPSIKDMPKFDPDAELTSLTLTIPSWASTIRRVKEKTDFNLVSQKAKTNLQSALGGLSEVIWEMTDSMEVK